MKSLASSGVAFLWFDAVDVMFIATISYLCVGFDGVGCMHFIKIS
jgi:hypothetical protein